MSDRGMSPTRAAERVLTERKSREQAMAAGLEIVDPRERFGDALHEHRLFEVNDVDIASGNVVGAIDSGQGTLVFYAKDKPTDEDATESAARLEAEARTAAQKARREAGKRLVASVPPREKLVNYFIDQYAYGVSALATSAEGWRLAQAYMRLEGLDATEFRVSARTATRSAALRWPGPARSLVTNLRQRMTLGSGGHRTSRTWTCCPSALGTGRPRGRKLVSMQRAASYVTPADR